MCVLSRVQLVAILWTVAHQPPPSMGFFRQEYWSGLPFPSAGDLPHSGIEPGSPGSPALQVGSLPSEPPGKPSSLEGPTFPGSWALLPSLQPAVLGRALFLGRLSASLSSVLPPSLLSCLPLFCPASLSVFPTVASASIPFTTFPGFREVGQECLLGSLFCLPHVDKRCLQRSRKSSEFRGSRVQEVHGSSFRFHLAAHLLEF